MTRCGISLISKHLQGMAEGDLLNPSVQLPHCRGSKPQPWDNFGEVVTNVQQINAFLNEISMAAHEQAQILQEELANFRVT